MNESHLTISDLISLPDSGADFKTLGAGHMSVCVLQAAITVMTKKGKITVMEIHSPSCWFNKVGFHFSVLQDDSFADSQEC